MRATAAAILTIALLAPAALAKSREYHSVVPIGAAGRVSVESHNGSVNVVPWAQNNVGIDARIESADWSDYPEDVDKTKIKVTRSGNDVRIESDYDAVTGHFSWFGFNRSLPPVHYTIHVPATTQLDVDVHNASIKVTGLSSEVTLETHNGSIDVANLNGSAKVQTHNGSVDIVNISGGAQVGTHNGNVKVVFANYSQPSRVGTHNGSIDIAVPATARMSLRLSAHRSNPLSTDFPMTIKASGSTTMASINGGGPEFDFTTHNGSIRVSKR